ncbi:MAG: DUF2723 domain-containing protein [Polyangiaceae bacterium]
MATVFAFGRRGLLFLAVSLASLAVYAPRTCRTVMLMGDSAELVAAAKQWGVPHPPGYPLYTALAHLLASLPFLDFPYSVHLSSALFHALTVAIVACTIDVISGSLAASLVGAVALALGETFLAGSLYAEVFPLHDLLFAALLFSSVCIAEGGRAASRAWTLFAILLGLAVSHHHMIALAFPAFVVLLAPALGRTARERPVVIALSVATATALPVAFYALLLAVARRSPLPSWGDVHDVASLVRLVTRQDYGGPLHASRHAASGQLLERLDAFAAATWHSFGAMGVVLLLVGAFCEFRRTRRIASALVLALFCAGPLFAMLNTVDIHSDYRSAFFARFFSMSHVAAAILAGLGFAAIERRIREHPRLETRRARDGAVALVTAVTAALLFANRGDGDLRNDHSGLAYAHDLVTSTPEDAILLLKSDTASQAALYVCAVEKQCADRIILTPGQLWMPWKRDEIRRRYPDLALPSEDAPSPTRWLVDRYVGHRPIFLHPELVDEAVHGSISVLPSLLLFRVYPDEPALRADAPRFGAELRSIAERRRCEGCMRMQGVPHSSAEAQLARLYDAAMVSHQSAATELGLMDEEAALARELLAGRDSHR